MYQLINQIGVTRFLAREAIPFGVSLVIAEVFYKFHSFTLELIAFLATWYVLSAVLSLLMNWREE